MKTKLTLLLALLAICVSGWAETTVTLVDGTNTLPFNKYGLYNNTSSPNTFTTNTTSGFAGLVLSAPTISQNTWWKQGCIALKPTVKGTPATVSLSVPSGYIITGLSMTVQGMNASDTYSVTVGSETKSGINGSTSGVFSESDLTSNTFSFTINQTGGTLNWLAIRSLTVTVAPHENSFDVTYNLYYNSVKITDETRKHLDGDTPAIPGSLDNGLCTYSYNVVTIDKSSTTEVNVTATSPFSFSSDFDNAIWYYIKERTSTTLYYSSSSGISSTKSSDNEEKWAFIGNPYNGVKVINKAAGKNKYLTRVGTSLSWDETGVSWKMAAHPAGNGFYLYDESGGKTYVIYLGSGGAVTALETTITYSSDAGTKGGQILLEAVPADFSSMVATNITPYFNTTDCYFGLTTTTANSLKETYTYWDGETECTESQYNTLFDAVMGAITYPSTGYYRIKNHNTNQYLGMESTVAPISNGTGASTVINLTNSENVFTLTIQGSTYDTGETYGTTLTPSLAIGSPGVFCLKRNGSGPYHYLRDSGSALEYWSAISLEDTPAAYWSIEDANDIIINLTAAVDNTSTEHTYATLCVPFNITALEGASSKEVKAYAPTKSGDYIIPGDGATTVAEGTPVLLIGESGATSVTATIGSKYAISPATTNALKGVFTGAIIDTSAETGTNFVLGKDATNGDRIGFYHVKNENFALNANRAYLKLDGSGNPTQVRGFVISFDDDGETGINTVSGSELMVNGPIYNLAGQRLNKMQKGINIVNGKKVLK